MHLSALLWALPRPSTPDPLFSERGNWRGLLASVCDGAGWAASPSSARTTDSQMQPHGLSWSHRACLILVTDSGQTLKL